ncbi:hypothetical protein [Streptomyces sp. 6N223]|uniref:hypothetical protein n=1 Tax=Streptomyces sp. 6N223 TaxID=3457412 RepID=UPI003FD69020
MSTMTAPLRALEERILRRALRNARAAVREDRERAAARRQAERSLRALREVRVGDRVIR